MTRQQIQEMFSNLDAHGKAIVRLALRKQAEGETVAARFLMRKVFDRIKGNR